MTQKRSLKYYIFEGFWMAIVLLSLPLVFLGMVYESFHYRISCPFVVRIHSYRKWLIRRIDMVLEKRECIKKAIATSEDCIDGNNEFT